METFISFQNYGYIMLGVLTTICVFAGTALVFEKVMFDFIKLTNESSNVYIAVYKDAE